MYNVEYYKICNNSNVTITMVTIRTEYILYDFYPDLGILIEIYVFTPCSTEYKLIGY